MSESSKPWEDIPPLARPWEMVPPVQPAPGPAEDVTQRIALGGSSPPLAIDIPQAAALPSTTQVAQPPLPRAVPQAEIDRLRSQVVPPAPIEIDTPRTAARQAVIDIKAPDLLAEMRKFVETGEINDSPVLKDALKFVVPEEADSPQNLQIKKLIRQVATLPIELLVGFPVDLIRDPVGTSAAFVQGQSQSINDFLIIQSPFHTAKERDHAAQRIADNPIGLAMTAAISTGIAKSGGKALFRAEEAVRGRLAPTEAGATPLRGTAEIVRAEEVPARITPEIEPLRPVEPPVSEQAAFLFERPESPLPPKAAPEPSPSPPQGEILGLNVTESVRLRNDLGLNQLDPAAQRTWESVLSRAKLEKRDISALEVADEIIKSNRPITDTEHAGMVLKAADLANQYDVAIAEISKFIESGDISKAKTTRIQAEGIIENLNSLTEGTRLGRRETARALSIGGMMINRETYQLAPVIQRAQASKGARLSTKENAQIQKLVDDQARLQDQLKQAEAANERLIAERDRQTAEMIATSSIARAKRTKRFEGIFEEREAIKAQLSEIGFRVNDVSGVTAESSFLIGKLAINYIKEGTATLSEVVRKVRSDVPSLTERDVHQSLNARDPKRQAQARTETTRRIADLKKQADLLLQIEKAEKGIFEKPKGKSPQSTEVRDLQTTLRDLRTQAYKSGMSPARLERALKTIAELQDQLNNQFRNIRRKQPIETVELASAKEKIQLLRRQMRVEDDLAALNEQLRTGDFIIEERPSLKAIPPELERSQIELKRARRKIRVAIDEMAPLTARGVAVEFVNTLRTLKATADMSATLRQGLNLSIEHPVLATKSSQKSIKSFFSEFTAEQVDNAIRSADHHFIREKAGLELTEFDGTRTRREEVFGARMIEKVPVLGPIVKASNRHMTTQLNLLRVGVFDEFLAKNPNATQAELSLWADYINVSTGRGNLGRFGAVASELSTVIFAPRFAVSRIQTPFMIFKSWKEPRVRKAIAKNMVAFVGAGVTALTLADMAGFEVGLNPRESDWGKIRIGDTRIDLWGGFQQPARVIARVGLAVTDKIGITGQELSEREKAVDPVDLLGRFAAYKLAPSVTLPRELITGETIVGEPVTPSQSLARAVLPLWLEDVADAHRQGGPGRATLVGGLTFLGVGAATFQDSESQTRRNIRQMKRDNNWIGADQLQNEWNMKNPDNPIRNVPAN